MLPNNESVAMKQPVENDKAFIINQVILRNVDRTMKRHCHLEAKPILQQNVLYGHNASGCTICIKMWNWMAI